MTVSDTLFLCDRLIDRSNLLFDCLIERNLRPHFNVVQFYGCCIQQDRVLVICEYLPLGSLESHLSKLSKQHKRLHTKRVVKFAMEVAAGLLKSRSSPFHSFTFSFSSSRPPLLTLPFSLSVKAWITSMKNTFCIEIWQQGISSFVSSSSLSQFSLERFAEAFDSSSRSIREEKRVLPSLISDSADNQRFTFQRLDTVPSSGWFVFCFPLFSLLFVFQTPLSHTE